MAETSIRLFVDAPLAAGHEVPLPAEQAHYLHRVMRLAPGDGVLAFNGQDGEWRCRIEALSGRSALLLAQVRTRPQVQPPDLWLLFAPLKKVRTDFIVEKAAELGVARLLPVQTERTNAERVNLARLQAHAREAAEQCEGLSVPPIAPLRPLAQVLAEWPADRHLAFCDEELAASTRAPGLEGAPPGPWAILTGPEGGFTPAERARLLALPQVHHLGLGPRILRADTAAVAAIVRWQLALGDWGAPSAPPAPAAPLAVTERAGGAHGASAAPPARATNGASRAAPPGGDESGKSVGAPDPDAARSAEGADGRRSGAPPSAGALASRGGDAAHRPRSASLDRGAKPGGSSRARLRGAAQERSKDGAGASSPVAFFPAGDGASRGGTAAELLPSAGLDHDDLPGLSPWARGVDTRGEAASPQPGAAGAGSEERRQVGVGRDPGGNATPGAAASGRGANSAGLGERTGEQRPVQSERRTSPHGAAPGSAAPA